MPSRSSHGADTKSTKADGSKSGSGTRKLFQSLALGLIEYSAEKYLKRDRSSPESSDAHSKSSHRSTRSRGPTTERTPVGRSGSSSTSRGDVTAVLGQLTIGLGALLVRQYLKHRKARKEKAKEEARIRDAQKKGQRVEGDPELRAGLDSLAGEAQRTSQSLRDIARTPPTHPNCEVVGALDQNADRLQQSLSNIQTGVHNIRNLRDDRLGRDGPAPRQRERKPDMDGERTRDRNRDWDQERARERERSGSDPEGYMAKDRTGLWILRGRSRDGNSAEAEYALIKGWDGWRIDGWIALLWSVNFRPENIRRFRDTMTTVLP
ncbi:hypothetical protein GQ53DRAFT_363588 [Thozetella sp. PMI_491]|nr:hypothetical protein GQ53DRAFT_363588 [Thozetella sp. PMI_491]